MAHASRHNDYSEHARARIQQRAIPPILIDFLIAHGSVEKAGGGAERWFFNRKGWRELERRLGPTSRSFSRYRNVYVILQGRTVITVAHRRR